jgi:CheY-like chemotaxis protein
MTRNFRRAGITNEIISFTDGQALLDFLFVKVSGPTLDPEVPYLLLLDIRMPRVDGIEALKKIKENPDLKKLPVIMISTTDDPRQILQCYDLGCNFFIVKPTEQAAFAEAIERLAKFISLPSVKVPLIEMIHEHQYTNNNRR